MAKKKKAEKPKREVTRRQLSHFKRQKRRQSFIFISGITIIVAIVLIVLVGWYLGEYRPLHTNIIVANDTKYNTSYLIDFLTVSGANQQVEKIQQLVDSAINQIIQDELIRQAAEQLGITVSDEDARKMIAEAGFPANNATMDLARAQLLNERLRQEYFDAMVPVSDQQVHMMAMLAESERTAAAVSERLASENFTALAEEFALNYYSKNVNKGDFDWHPRVILKEQVGSDIPLEFAFSAEVGALSEPLRDEKSYKQRGYWLLRLDAMSIEGTANVSTLYLSSEQEAELIRDRLLAGDNLTALADEYTQYSPSKEKHGELEDMAPGEVNEVFDGYVFSANVTPGVWSQPIQDNSLWTQGGSWLVKVVDREDDRELSDEDRDKLIETAYNDWVAGLQAESADTTGSPGLTPELRQRVVDEVLKANN